MTYDPMTYDPMSSGPTVSGARRIAGRSVGVAASIGPGAVASDGSVAGSVVGTGSAGFYVQVDDTYLAVLSRGAHPGPIHLVLHGEAPTVAEGSAVWMEPTRLVTEVGSISLARAVPFRPEPLAGPERANAVRVLARQDWDSPPPSDLAAVWPTLLHRLAADDEPASGLGDAFRLLTGRGGGLTPTGDDVLAGLLLAGALFRDGRDPGDPPSSVTTVAVRGRRLAAEAATSALSRAFLHWAARGLSIEPVHEVVAAAGANDLVGLQRSARLVSAVGSSSGGALLAGLCVGCRFLSPHAHRHQTKTEADTPFWLGEIGP